MTKRIWSAVAVMARVENGTSHIEGVALQVTAASEDEARGRAVLTFQNLYPQHGTHGLTLTDITDFCKGAVAEVEADEALQ